MFLCIIFFLCHNTVFCLFDNFSISYDIWRVGQGVGLCDGADDFAWASGGKGHRRNVPRDDGTCADDAAVADRDARTDDDVCSEPAVVTDFDRFRVTEMSGITVFV